MSEKTAPPTPRLKGKVALVTGASKGIGLAVSKKLVAEGCDLVITSRNHDALHVASRDLEGSGTRVLAKACDVSKISDVESLFTAVRHQYERLDILINNAGISHAMSDVDQLAPEVWERVIGTNLTGMFLVTRAAVPLMQAGASIVNNLSGAAKIAFAGEAAYIASKHGALGLTRTLREELRSRGIRVIALLPGPTDTEIWDQFWPDAPRAKMMSAEAIADAVLSALLLPANASVDELVINHVTGAL